MKQRPGIPDHCPIPKGIHGWENSTEEIPDIRRKTMTELREERKGKTDEKNIFEKLTPQGVMPNGVYLVIIRVFNDDDPVGFAVWFNKLIDARAMRQSEETF